MSDSEIGTLEKVLDPPAAANVPVFRPAASPENPVRFSQSPLRTQHCPHQLRTKRTLDILIALIGLVTLSPALLVLMVLIRLESRGPAIFRQRRIGKDGQEFDILKLRTMVEGAESWLQHLMPKNIYADSRLFKIHGDPRVTRLGRILRKTSLDEIPQLVNVLRGEMSLVGPRPPLPSEVASYADTHWERLSVIPGITGPWQVAGRNQITSFDEVVRLEREYIRGWNLGEDFKILLKTIPTVLLMRGAH